ncbi:MAG TPA: site-2 protease family protein [candidate division WOR-3 bacterium]|uniref:Site-2 protease family protein n=1 Tax=candidate division WOR-3 bacterium TaxID=2052148 RepID=A0A7V0T442_UNCW3|nr:site-2 protease family protein [candidate division WOR-3 bacterium]
MLSGRGPEATGPKVAPFDPADAGLREHFEVSGLQDNVLFGRLREPVRGSIAALRRWFAERGLVAWVSPEEEGHSIVVRPVPRLAPPRRWVNLLLFALTVLTTLFVGAFQMGRNPIAAPLEIVYGFPFSLSILLILGSHELGHYLVARRLGVDATLPYFLPVPHPMTGTMGAFIKMRSPVPDKGALVRVGIAGPLVGFLVAVPVTVVGLALSRVVEAGPEMAGISLGSSLVFRLLSWLRFGSLPEGQDVMLHPVAFAGWLGFFVTALNLLPAGQLDGGHIVYAIAGRFRKALGWVVIGALLLLGRFWLGWPFWAVLIALFGLRHPRPLDTVSPLTALDKWLAVVALVLLVLTFMPAPFGAVRI